MTRSPPDRVESACLPPRPALPLSRRCCLAIGCLLLGGSLLAGTSGCGYAVGAPYSPEIRSVYVPVFKSMDNRRGYEYQLTEAVQKQIQMRTPFRLVKEGEADTKLTGKITNMRKDMLGLNGYSDVRELQFNLAVEVTWEDTRSGKILAQQRIPLPNDIVNLTSNSQYAPEIGQSLATATDTSIQLMARNIVDMMEQPW